MTDLLPLSPSPAGWLESLLCRRGKLLLAFYWPLLAASTHLSLSGLEILDTGDTGLDKARHFSCFGFLALLLWYAWPGDRGRGRGVWGRFVAVGLAATAYAAVDECTQSWVGRTVDLKDFLANLGGIAMMTTAAAVQQSRSQPDRDEALTNEARPERSAGPPQPNDAATRFVGHAVLVSVLTFLSRVMGMARDLVMAACFGMSALSDAFWIGFIVPNLFRRLFGEGALTASFIPVYSGLVERDPQTARRLVWLCIGCLSVVLGIITLLGELILALLPRVADVSSDTLLAIRLTMIMLPYMPMVCVVALMSGVLQVHHRFGPPAVAPILLNVMMIAAALLSTWGWDDPEHLRWAIHVVAWSELITGLFQLGWVGWAMLPYAGWTTAFQGARAAFREILTTMLPMTVSLAIFQINTLVDSLVAWGLSPKNGHDGAMNLLGWTVAYPIQPGAVTALQYAQRLYQFPLGVFGIAVATAIFPMLSRAAPGRALGKNLGKSPAPTPGNSSAANSTAKDGSGPCDPQADSTLFRTILQHGLRLTMFIGLPATVGLILLREPLVRLIFERKQFTAEDTTRVATILAAYATAVWAYSMSHVLQRAFYALKDAKTPLRISLYMVAMNVCLNLTLVWWLGATALALSTALCAMVQVACMLVAIRKRVPNPVDAGVLSGWGQTAVLTAVMAGIIWPTLLAVDHPGLGWVPTAGLVGGLLLVSFVVVFGGAKLWRLDEMGWMLSRSAKKTNDQNLDAEVQAVD